MPRFRGAGCTVVIALEHATAVVRAWRGMNTRIFARHSLRAPLSRCICALALIGALAPLAAQVQDSATAPLRVDRAEAIREALAQPDAGRRARADRAGAGASHAGLCAA